MMNNFITSPLWAIAQTQTPHIFDMYQRQLDFYSNRPETKTETHEGVEVVTTNFSMLGSNVDLLAGVPATFDVQDGVGVLPIAGMVIPESDIFSLFFGGFAALDILTRDFLELKGRDDIHTIVLDINSPGGSAFGVQQFANLIFDARDTKPIVAVTSGMMASAAMWIGAAAHRVYITGDVTVTGSIGTVTSHVDISAAERMAGIKTTEVAAGEFKRLPSMFEPLTTKGKLVLQDQVNHANRAFILDISKFKNVLASIVIAKMAEGKTFIGTQGVDVGLIDGLISMEDLFTNIADAEAAKRFTGKPLNNFNILKGGNSMTLSEQIAELKNSSHEVYEALVDMGRLEARSKYETALPDALAAENAKGVEAGKIEGKAEGQKAEAERIQGIRELSTASNTVLIETFIADGKTYAPEAAVAILKAQKETNAVDLKSLEKQSPAALNVDVIEETTDNDKKGLRQLVKEYQAEHKCSKGVAITACTKEYPNAENDFIGTAKKQN